jgi:hypothetical protein
MRRRALLGLVPLAFAACSIPTELPNWDMTWDVPAKATTIEVNSFLPAGVSLSGNAFGVSVANTTISRTLSQDCAACAAANGQVVPKPDFTGTGTGSATLPSGVASATLGTSSLRVTIANGFNFDPIKPAASTNGWLRIVVTSNGVVLGRDSINGATTTLPAGTSLVRNIALTGTIVGNVVVTTTLASPAGDAVAMDASRSITFTAAANPITATSASVTLAGQQVQASSDLDLSGIDEAIKGRATGATLLLSIVNPFSTTGTLTVRFTGGPAAVTKTIQLQGATTAANPQLASVVLSAADLQNILGHQVTLNISGPVSGTTTVQPTSQVTVSSRMQLTLTVKKENN